MSKFKVCAAVLASALVGVNAFGAECTYTDGAWDTAPSGESDDIVIVSGDLTWGTALPHKVASWRQEAGTVTFETTYGAAFPLFEVTGDVALNGGSWTHKANSDAETYRLNVKVCGDMTVAEEAVVDAYMKGFAATKGIGAPSQSGWGGGAHGGRGYEGLAKVPCEPSVCYGSLTRPTELGAGSGNLRPVSGGGAICLVVVGSLTVDGLIDANGADTSVAGFSSGPGGSVWITAGQLLGGGSIEANANGLVCRGSTASSDYNVSGGGRVAVWLTGDGADFTRFSGKTTAYGAFLSGSVTEAAGPGTVYLKTAAQAEDEGTLIVDNGGAQARTFTDIGGSVTDTAVGRVLVSEDSMLRLVDGGVLSVSGDIENHGSFTGVGDSTLEFVGAGVSKVSGDLSVSGFVCRTPGKGVVFGDGATLSVSGKFTLQGADGNPVVFAAADGAESFNLNVASTAEQSVKNVSVAKCNASSGAKIVAMDSEKDAATTNWDIVNIIPGQVIVWTGRAGAPGWLLADNWDLGRAPVETDCAVVNLADIQPVLTKQLAIAKLTVATGATLSLAGYDLTVTGDLAVAGTILPSGAETIAVGGNATLNADGLVAKRSTFVLNGTAAQTFDPCGASFCNLVWDNSSAEGVAVLSSFTALYLTAQTVTARRITFAEGITATCSAGLVFSGDDSTQNLTLVPSVAGKTWNLAVSGTAAVNGVTVSGSQATLNQVYANDSIDAGGNVGWNFGTFVSAVWKGTSNSDFHTAANWEPAAVPDENTAVVIDSTRPVTISQPVTVRELVVGGTSATAVTLNKSIKVTGAMVLKDLATVTVNAKDVKIKVDSSLVMQRGAKLTHIANPSATDNPYHVELEVGRDMIVEDGAAVDALGKGYPKRVGPGCTSTVEWSGGCHGGRGWDGVNARDGLGVCYGSVTRPTEVGSGTSTQYYGEYGGGAIRIIVGGKLTNDGLIGANGSVPNSLASGSGGSVWLTVGSLVGKGYIEANGGGNSCRTSTTSHSPSAGGRVAVYLTDATADFSAYDGEIVAYGTRRTATDAAAPGTVYLKKGSEADNGGTLIIDNGGRNSYSDVEIGSLVTDAEVGTVWIKAKSKLKLLETGHLTVRGNIVNEGTFSGVGESVLEFAGSGISTINSDLSVSGFTCREPGKTISVADGKTLTVTGKFTVEGSEDAKVTLRSESGASVWGLKVDAKAEQSVKHVSVSMCDASAGAEIVANDSEKDEATLNWKVINIVPGETITWTGDAGVTAWPNPGNWDLGRVPVETDFVVIAPAAIQPMLTANAAAARLTINEGASLSLAGFDLTVNGDFAANGQLKAAATERILVTGNAAFAAKSFVKDYSTLVLAGTAAQTFLGGDNSFYNLVFANTSADGVTVGSSFEASFVTAETAEPTQIAFASGVTATVGTALALTGDAMAKNLTLKPAVESATWNLKVKGTANVSGVRVSGSQATGNEIYASDSVDAGGNTKWHFGAFSAVKWIGETSDAFDEPSNWEGGVVPDANAAVEIDADKPVKITSEVTVRELIVGGSAASSVLVKAPVNVVGAMVLRDRATVTADAKVTVGGSLVMNSGSTLTHSVNGTADNNRVWVDVAGDVSVEENAAISTDGKGFVNGGPGRATNSGGSHGGMGGTHGTAADCYGSIFCPTNSGSSGNSPDATAAGGGVVRMAVAGTLFVDGAISADGTYHGNWYAGSGGSVWIVCGSLQGHGRISANGGESGSGYHGAGGRVAVYLTEAGAVLEEDNGVAVEAYPGRLLGAPGTVYVQTADQADFGGTLKVVNHPDAGEFGGGNSGAYVQYPSPRMSMDRKRNGVSLVLGGYARLSLTDNVRVSSLEVLDQKPKVFLNGHVLKINQPEPKDWVVPSYIIPGEDAEGNPGRIEWKTGLILFLR